ncbi:unnamed protein product [Spirodela intermedia]|uniref:Uncharacterized protein n=1 Tax=Spirodela intermedia TaxID=51605 RepID=A0A7I8JS23_SPIIN|nr:unnamed protein product [Spirodela intermedia]CAA6672545.1 unnamed protein product [Spirodela intermedia]
MCHSSNCGGHFSGRKTAAKNFQTCISCQSISNMSKKDEMPMSNMLVRSMKWVVESVSGGCHMTERKSGDFAALCKVPSLACTTTLCPTVGWPPMTWKGSGIHVPY